MLDDRARIGTDARMPPYRPRLYRQLESELGGVAIATFGGPEELAAETAYPGLKVLCNRWRLPSAVYRQQFPWLHRRVFEASTVIRAEQLFAAPLATDVARHYGKPLIVRLGYAPSSIAQATGQGDIESYRRLETEAFRAADLIVVTTEELRKHVTELSRRRDDEVVLVPNYVDCEFFAPGEPRLNPDLIRVLTVGRLARQKNFETLIHAVAGVPGIHLDIVGEGPLRQELGRLIEDLGLDHVHLHGWVPPEHLLRLYRQSQIYIQPSLVEGHPKTVLEAMAVGLPVIGADVSGIRNLVTDGEDGFLCGTSVEGIRSSLETLVSDPDLRRVLGRAARAMVKSMYDLPVVAKLELEAILRAHKVQGRPRQPLHRPLLSSGRALVRAALGPLARQMRQTER